METITKGVLLEDGSGVFLARVLDAAGENANQAAFSSITYKVFDTTAANVEVATGTVTIATAVFNTLQSGGHWDADVTGYTFKHVIEPSGFPTGSNEYRVEYKLTFADGSVGWLLFDIETINVLTS